VIYPAHFEDKIGFSRIRELVMANCLFEPGREIVGNLTMLHDLESVEEEIGRVNEFRLLQLSDKDFPVHQFHDSRTALKKAAIEGTFMEVDEVHGLSKSLESVRLIVRFFETSDPQDYPRLKELAKTVSLYPFISDRISKVLNKNGQIRDNASRELVDIRREITSKQSSVTRQLDKLVKRARAEGWMDDDLGATFRNGRPVIPVSSSHKRSMGGLVHDESATGKTVYVEPAEVVELTNQIRELEYAERREIIRILTDFTNDIRPYIKELQELHQFLAVMDSIRARALFAIKINAVKPRITEKPRLAWIKAIHPLLYLTLKPAGREVVPLNMNLDAENRILLISGPNAGGKSVCLQTVGLLQYMFQSGLLVPVDEESEFGIFSGIFIDIGDEQSIENDLSTYSSHLFNMKYFLRNADTGSLVLIDEFGTGTEPMLGGAIAEAILEGLNLSGTFGVITTHYTNLKHVAASTSGIINGAMLFDNQRMQPLYELQIGKPGSSFAFEIARKIGLPEEILASAADKIGQDHIDFDRHLKDILRDKKYWERKRQKVRQTERKLEELMASYEEEVGMSEKKRKTLIDEAKRQAEDMLAQANRQIENTIREIRESNADRERTRQSRKELEEFRDELQREDSQQDKEKAAEFSRMKKRSEELGRARPDLVKKTKQKVQPAPVNEEIHAGDTVCIAGQDTAGEVEEIRGKKAIVVFGHIKTTVDIDKLVKVDSAKAGGPPKTMVNLGEWNVSNRRANFRREIDLRGKRAEEALRMVNEYVDEAVMVGAPEVRILHGKGDGILRQLIREQLHSNNVVEWYGDEHIERGGAGITVVRFAY